MLASVLGSGSKGNSTLIEINNKKILIDVGFSYSSLKKKLEEINVYPKDIDYIFITHDHVDHTYGLKVFLNKEKPTLLISSKIYPKLDFEYNKVEFLQDVMYLDDIKVKVIHTSHDATDSVGFVIESDTESLVYITDTGYIHKNNLEHITNKNYYIIESNHDTEMLINGRYPLHLQKRILSDKGHLSNELCAGYLSRIIGENTKKVVLAHLSEENNTPYKALETVNSILKDNNICFDNIECASQDEILEVTK